MFYGLASGAVATDGIEVEQVLADIETLNRAAFEGRYEVTAVSFHAYAHLQDRYALLPHGASMGDRYGPILVARSSEVAPSDVAPSDVAPSDVAPSNVAPSNVAPSHVASSHVASSHVAPSYVASSYVAPSYVASSYVAPTFRSASASRESASASRETPSLAGMRIAIPGRLTSAYLALRLYDHRFEPEVVAFDQIQQAVVDGRVDAGLLIHEGQLTYQRDGLRKIVDLGEWWFDRTGGLPLPLGGNIIRRDLGPETMRTVSKMLHDSIAYALAHRADAVKYAEQFGRGLNRTDTDTFVGMYVNQLTLDYGDRGRAALERFYAEALERGFIPNPVPLEFTS
jgi:1,4-dihydroxy-6-naphthoate synthase